MVAASIPELIPLVVASSLMFVIPKLGTPDTRYALILLSLHGHLDEYSLPIIPRPVSRGVAFPFITFLGVPIGAEYCICSHHDE